MSVHQACQESFRGRWDGLADASGISHADVQAFLDYAASFLSNIGNYYGSGDQKFVPSMEKEFFEAIFKQSDGATAFFAEISPFVDPSEALVFQKHKYSAYYIWVVLYELLGHGTGKVMTEESGTFNFDIDIENPPIDPVTKASISSWYRPGQTWTGVFVDLATTVDACRAELVGAYLMDDTDLLSLFGFTSTSTITAPELTYNMYVQLGVDGLRGLQNFNVEDSKWGQAHSRAHFAMLKCLLSDGNGFMRVDCDSAKNRLTVFVDRSRIVTDGKPALGGTLLMLHMYRCTAGVGNCRAYSEELSRVEGQYLEWRRIVLAKKQPEWVFVQANTSIEDAQVILKEYDATPEGVI